MSDGRGTRLPPSRGQSPSRQPARSHGTFLLLCHGDTQEGNGCLRDAACDWTARLRPRQTRNADEPVDSDVHFWASDKFELNSSLLSSASDSPSPQRRSTSVLSESPTMEVAASVAGIFSLGIQVTQNLIAFYSAYKSQKSDVAYTFEKLDRLLGVLEKLRTQLADRTDEQSLLENIESSIQACDEFIQKLQRKCNKFKDNPAKDIRAAARTATYRLAYPFRQSTLQKLDENVDEVVSHLSLALQVLGQKDIANVQHSIEDTKGLLDLVRAGQTSSTIRVWLKAHDATINYNEDCKKRHGGTGLWLVKGSSFATSLTQPH